MKKCPRKLKDCIPYSIIMADDKSSFFCTGKNDGTRRKFEQDKYTKCFYSENDDVISHCDARDLTHEATVILNALAIIADEELNDKEG